VARSFAGDKKQMVPLLKAALKHKGTSVLDIISPCVTFNDFEGSTKGWDWAKEHEEPLHELGFVPRLAEIEVEQKPRQPTRPQRRRVWRPPLTPSGSWATGARPRGCPPRPGEGPRPGDESLPALLYAPPRRKASGPPRTRPGPRLPRLPNEALRPPRAALETI